MRNATEMLIRQWFGIIKNNVLPGMLLFKRFTGHVCMFQTPSVFSQTFVAPTTSCATTVCV